MAIAELPPQSARHDRDPRERGLRFPRSFTREGVHPYDEIAWELRDAVIPELREAIYGEAVDVFSERQMEVSHSAHR